MASLYLYHYYAPNKKAKEYPSEYYTLMLRKVIPMGISCVTMISIFFSETPPVIVFALVAFIEFFSDLIGEFLTDLPAALMPDPHDFQERLGLLFMLVLGETMVGVLFVPYNQQAQQRTYGTVIPAFFIVSSIGMQFFERAQSDPNHTEDLTLHAEGGAHEVAAQNHAAALSSALTQGSRHNSTRSANSSLSNGLKSHAERDEEEERAERGTVSNPLASSLHNNNTSSSSSHEGVLGSFRDSVALSIDRMSSIASVTDHPLLLNKIYYGLYVWLHAFISFFMLISTSALVMIYYNVAGLIDDDVEKEDYSFQREKGTMTGGLVCMWLTMLAMELLQPTYRRSLLAGLRDPDPTGQNRYSKLLFSLKFVVICLHVMLFYVSNNKGNYFVGYSAVIAGLPSMFDCGKLLGDYITKKEVSAAEKNDRHDDFSVDSTL
eukprot:gene26508-33097_t